MYSRCLWKKIAETLRAPWLVKLNRSHFLSVYQRTTQEFGGGSKEGKLIESDVHFLHNFYDKAPNKMTFFFFKFLAFVSGKRRKLPYAVLND